jgi:hypothetical protein
MHTKIFNIFVILLIILLHFHNGHGLDCIANSSLKISRSNLTLNSKPVILHKLSNKTIRSFSKNSLCHVRIYIDYNQTDGDVIIEFGLNTNHTAGYLSIETWFPLVKGNDSIRSYVDHVCSLDDLCDRIFVETWINSLANIKHEPLQNKLIYLLASKIHSGKCDVAGILTQCSSGMCVVKYNANIRMTTNGTGCIDNVSSTATELYVKIQSIRLQPMRYEEIIYTCMSDQCNNPSTFKRIWRQTTILFDYIEPIMKWLRFRNHIKQLFSETFNRVQTVMEDQSHWHETTTTDYFSLSTVSSICILIIFLGFIWACCCVFCCKSQ